MQAGSMTRAASSLLALVLTATSAAGQSAPSPRWLWATPLHQQSQDAFLRTTFTVKRGLIKAVLVGACDGAMRIYVNGQEAGQVRGYEEATTVDLTRWLRPGPNVLAIAATKTGDAAGVVAVVELADADGHPQYLATDKTWRCTAKPQAGWQELTFDDGDWQRAVSLGLVGSIEAQRWGNPFASKQAIDAYNGWKLASGAAAATDAAAIAVPPGFTVEMLRSAQPGEDSWVSMAFDPQGRITIAREKQGLLRMTPGRDRIGRVEVIEDSLLECRGLLYAFDSLYVNANNSKGFYRLRDLDNNGRFDPNERQLLLATGGGVGHGRNHVVLGPDDMLYLVHGDAVELTDRASPDSPYRHYDIDRLLRNPWDKQWSGGQVASPGGHILRTDKDGKKFEVIAGGLRNPMDIAFNEDGEMFTYEADLEWDVGLPWYRPTRVLHVVSGGEYGWRRGTANWPGHYPDSLPAACDIGLGSPTGVEFGTSSGFPGAWKKALYICEWAYGRILAVHLEAKGATYTGRWERFATGRPLNVTDLKFGPDGAMYFITGGRGTQSGLYRVRFTGDPKLYEADAKDNAGGKADPFAGFEAKAARLSRRINESHHARPPGVSGQEIVEQAMEDLKHTDRWVRFAARVALENQHADLWKNHIFREQHTTAALTGLLALARVGDEDARMNVLAQLNVIGLAELDEAQLNLALRTYTVAFARLKQLPVTVVNSVRGKLESLYPSRHGSVNHALVELLVAMQSPQVIEKTIRLLKEEDNPADIVQYLTYLRYVKRGWKLDQLQDYFVQLNRATQLHTGRYYQGAMKAIRAEIVAGMPQQLRQQMGGLIEEPRPPVVSAEETSFEKPTLVRQWTADEAYALLDHAAPKPDFAAGRKAFIIAQCIKCHRIGNEGAAAELGPDLTGVGFRFDRKALMESVIEPSKVIAEKYQQVTFTLKDGDGVTGIVEKDDGGRIVVRTNLLSDQTRTISSADVTARKPSAVSAMPTGLADVLTNEQILQLLAYLQSGGNPNDALYQRGSQ